MTGPRYTKLIESLPSSVPFVAPEQMERQRGAPFLARLGANENIFGPSPKALEAIRQAADNIWKYGEPDSHALRHALAAHHNVGPENILVGEGIDGLLGYLVRLLISPGDPVVTSDGAYPTFNYHVSGYGGQLHKVPYKDDHEDIQALINKSKSAKAKLIYFANPDNPMGTFYPGADITAALSDLPENCLFLLDEAYIEFAPEGTSPEISTDDPRVIRMRTFSKAYGMAGARVGYAIGTADLIRSFDKIRNHFGMCLLSQAGAMAALEDQEWINQTIEKVSQSRTAITDIAAQNGLTALPSAANFVTVDCGVDGDFARKVLSGLIEQGVFVRMPFVAPQDRCIRISCGREADLEHLAKALPIALENAK
ncbi:Histidinol-phosphate aminotransferase [Roseovarius albus]|uniref:Histidinol-phosphate aminotransferase n=1 Tax=Roseovarius albus TaxID=1247867 RepID=A0A1X6Y8F3_9RHOB|nr:pyridoxal phosphate-dependent aminotransferase [Roseovarius albus]SLN13734.1 Histidinol-phosphate aminotransferase [Roseovarius albus]